MMAVKNHGKLIIINGPSFSGKTYLSNKITSSLLFNDFVVSNISYECVYNVNVKLQQQQLDYMNLLDSKINGCDVLITESTINKYGFDKYKSLIILCLPDLESHIKFYNDYKCQYGSYDAIRRSYWNDVSKMRDEFNKVYKYQTSDFLIFKSNDDYDLIMQEVMKYVSS